MLLLVVAIDDYVIYVDQAANSQQWSQDLIEDPLEVSRGIT